MGVRFILEELPDTEEHVKLADIHYAWDRWRKESCIERNRGHLWELELDHPEDGSGVTLWCSYCSAGVDDVYPDGQDLIDCDLENGITVRSGVHNSQVQAVIPVSVKLWKQYYYFGDWDVGIALEQIGPARELEEA